MTISEYIKSLTSRTEAIDATMHDIPTLSFKLDATEAFQPLAERNKQAIARFIEATEQQAALVRSVIADAQSLQRDMETSLRAFRAAMDVMDGAVCISEVKWSVETPIKARQFDPIEAADKMNNALDTLEAAVSNDRAAPGVEDAEAPLYATGGVVSSDKSLAFVGEKPSNGELKEKIPTGIFYSIKQDRLVTIDGYFWEEKASNRWHGRRKEFPQYEPPDPRD